MSDDAFRERFRVELARRGLDERAWAAEVLGIVPDRFWVLSDAPLRVDSSKCLAFFGPGSPHYSRDYTWRTPVATLDEFAEMRIPTTARAVLVDMARMRVVQVTLEDMNGDDAELVTIEEGWRGEELDRPCICRECAPDSVPMFSTLPDGNPRFGVLGGNTLTPETGINVRDWLEAMRGLYLPSGDGRIARAITGRPGDGSNLVRVTPAPNAEGSVTPPT